MEFGSLDDDLFESHKDTEKNKRDSKKYFPKTCENEWFLTEASSTSEDDSTIVKYKGDLNYFEGNYGASYVNHKQALEAATNTTVRRDCLEAVARSCIKLSKLDEALHFSELMFQESCNAFQKTNASYLLATVYHATQRYKDELVHLQHFASQNEWNADVWFRLALCYANVSGICIPHVCGEVASNQQELVSQPQNLCPEIHRFDCDCSCLTCPCHRKRVELSPSRSCPVKARIFACAYRSRWLYESCQTGNRSFASKRFDLAPKKLSRFLSDLDMEDSFWPSSQKNMIDNCDEVDVSEDVSDKIQASFEIKWFSWIDS